MTITIREARPADAEQLIAHVQRLLREPESNMPLAPDEFTITVEQERQLLADYAAAANVVLLVAESDGQLIGELSCKGGTRRALRHAATLGLSVRREWRNCGVGARLIQAAIDWARQGGLITRIELQVLAGNHAAIHLYQKLGFVVEGRRQRAVLYNGEYLDDLIMAYLL